MEGYFGLCLDHYFMF